MVANKASPGGAATEQAGQVFPRCPVCHRSDVASPDLAGLIVSVERALDVADTLDLTFVGLDLCSALERLNALAPIQNSSDPSTSSS